MKSRVKGAASTRRLIRRLPDAARAEMAEFLDASGKVLLGRAKAETPTRSGRLRAALRFRLLKNANLEFKLGLITKAAQRRFFYGYILDNGRKAQRARVRRGPRAGSFVNVRAISRERYNFVFGRRQDFRDNFLPKIRLVWEGILRRAASGVGND